MTAITRAQQRQIDWKTSAEFLRVHDVVSARDLSRGKLESQLGECCPRTNPRTCPGPCIPGDMGSVWRFRTKRGGSKVRILCAECSANLLDEIAAQLGGIRLRVQMWRIADLKPRGEQKPETEAERIAREEEERRVAFERGKMHGAMITEMAGRPPGIIDCDEAEALCHLMQTFRGDAPRRPNWLKWEQKMVHVVERYAVYGEKNREHERAVAEMMGEATIARDERLMEKFRSWISDFITVNGRD